jgi:CRP-like cAMP-binding protein
MLDKGLLKSFLIFSAVPRDKLEAMEQLGDLLEFDAQEIIGRENEPAINLYGVVDGEVELSFMFKDKILKREIRWEESISTRVETLEKPIVIDTVGPGEIFGWSSLVSPERLTATIRCSKPTRVFSLLASELKAMFDQDATLGYLFMERLAEIISLRLKHRTDKLIDTWGETFEGTRL